MLEPNKLATASATTLLLPSLPFASSSKLATASAMARHYQAANQPVLPCLATVMPLCARLYRFRHHRRGPSLFPFPYFGSPRLHLAQLVATAATGHRHSHRLATTTQLAHHCSATSPVTAARRCHWSPAHLASCSPTGPSRHRPIARVVADPPMTR
ncbi:hypothetical protein NL676_008200 [Syzygium grande]|nr:hypothetical protein NL676_008200 [Syzygium grande]